MAVIAAPPSMAIRDALCSGALHGSAALIAYGLTETALVMTVPALKHALAGLLPGIGGAPAFTSVEFSGFAMVLYAATGAILGGVTAALVSVAARLREPDAERSIASAAGALTLGIVFTLHAALMENTSLAIIPTAAAPLALALLRFRSALRPPEVQSGPTWPHPLTIGVVVAGSAYVAQPRAALSPLFRALAASAFIVCLLLLAARAEPLIRSAGSHVRSRLTRFGKAVPLRTALAMLVLASLASVFVIRGGRARSVPRAAAAPGGVGPNVILITLDTVRADHLSMYGYERETTPNLRRLAGNQATWFTRAVASSNWTLPTHASLFTGQIPSVHGADITRTEPAGRALSAQTPVMAELLSERGYTTAAIVANCVVLTSEFGFHRGFSEYVRDCTTEFWISNFMAPTNQPYLLRESARWLVASLLARWRRDALFADADVINARAIKFLESAGPRQPFFLFLNYMDAHTPYLPPAPFDSLFPGKAPSFRWESYPNIVDEVLVRRVRAVSETERRHLVSQYDGAIAYLDDRLQRLFARLRELALFDNTLIVVTSDHGEAFGESQIMSHGTTLYEHQVRVPLIVKFPRASVGSTVDAVVSSVDVLPTILEAAGAATPTGLNGRSLARSDRLGARWVVSETYHPRAQGASNEQNRPAEVAFYAGTLKQIVQTGGPTELYDLAADPRETTDLHGRRSLPPESHLELSSYLERVGIQSRAGKPVTDPAVHERLRALGYIR